MTKQFEPSAFQQAVFDWVKNGRGDAVVEAVAGSGKTTTLVEAAKLLNTSKATFLAFNKHVAGELQERLGKTMICKTIHSVGMGTLRSHLRKVSVDDNKYYDLAKPYAQEIAEGLYARYKSDLRQWGRSSAKDIPEPREPPKTGFITNQLKQLAHYCMVTLTPVADITAVEEMIDTFTCLDDSLNLTDLHYPLQSLLKEGEQVAANRGSISYDDMLWLPHQWNLHPAKQEWVYIDESQDLSAAQLDLVLKMRGRGGRMLFVGDPKQAIYGFAGACSDSIDRIIKKTKAIVLPLSICYRCPTKHIALAKEYAPQIEPAPNATEGVVGEVSPNRVADIIREGDLIVSRCTAPVIKLCIELISKRIPARVRGRDIGRSLTALVKEIATHPEFKFEEFGEFLDEYRSSKIARLEQKKNSQSQIESLCDRLDGIAACWQAFNSTSIEGFCLEIEELFSDVRSSVILSTVHRAKGLEEKRVFILRPDLLPLRWIDQQDWELEQEHNLCYVALTRAKFELYFIQNKAELKEECSEATAILQAEDEQATEKFLQKL